jgi:hypothetical protein
MKLLHFLGYKTVGGYSANSLTIIWESNADMDSSEDGDDNPPSIYQWFVDYWNSFTSQFSLSNNNDELYHNYTNGSSNAERTIQHRSTMNNIAYSEKTPYFSISVGKQANESFPLDQWVSLTITPTTSYFSYGMDYTVSTASSFIPISIGVTAGFYIGPSSGITGTSVGGGGGSYLGMSYSRSVNDLTLRNTWNDSFWGGTTSFGITLSNSSAYVSSNIGYTVELPYYFRLK